MTNHSEEWISEGDLFGALRSDLPEAEAMAARVRDRLHAEGPEETARRGSGSGLLRLAEWTGLRGVAASIVGPVLLPLGLARTGAVGGLAAKGLLPKSLLTTMALPFAVLMVIGLTLRQSLRRTTELRGELQGELGAREEASEAVAQWWRDHRTATVVFAGLLVLVNLGSHSTAKVLLFLAGIVALSLCAEVLSKARRASRHSIAMAAFNIGMAMYLMGHFVVTGSDVACAILGIEPHRRDFHHVLLDILISLWSIGVLLLASVQGRSRFMGPWKLLTEGTDRDLGKVAGVVLVVAASPGLLIVQWWLLQHLEGSIGEKLWESRASIAWIAFCVHALILVKRAPADEPAP